WGADLLPVEAGDGGRVFALADPAERPAGLYLGETLLERGSLDAVERADGVRVDFTVPGASDGEAAAVALVGSAILLEGQDFEISGNELVFNDPPAFNTPIRIINGDYQYLDAESGTVVLARPSEIPPRAATRAVTLAEALVGDVDGENRT